jgi:threonine/homoserine/homoserine lactone efflux protein
MILSLLTGLVIGFCVAMPPGPVMFVIVRGALHEGKQYAMKIAYGIAVLDVIYSFIFSLATGKITQAVSAFSTQFPQLVIAFQVACILGLIIYGIVNIHNSLRTTTARNRVAAASDETTMLPKFMRTLAKHGPFFLGTALALTHLVNPTFVPLMTSVAYVAGHYGFLQEGALWQHVGFALGYASGVLAWLSFLVFVSERYRHLFSESVMVKINRLLGMTMIGVGTYWGFHRFEVVLWALRDMLKLGLTL